MARPKGSKNKPKDGTSAPESKPPKETQQEDDRKERLDGVEPSQKTRRRSGPSKRELEAELAAYKEEDVAFKTESTALITDGLFSVLQGMTGLNFREVTPELKHNMDKSLTLCMNLYGGDTFGKYAPAATAITMTGLVVVEAIAKTPPKKKIPKPQPKTDSQPISEKAANPHLKTPVIIDDEETTNTGEKVNLSI